jgi:hypothetical protein
MCRSICTDSHQGCKRWVQTVWRPFALRSSVLATNVPWHLMALTTNIAISNFFLLFCYGQYLDCTASDGGTVNECGAGGYKKISEQVLKETPPQSHFVSHGSHHNLTLGRTPASALGGSMLMNRLVDMKTFKTFRKPNACKCVMPWDFVQRNYTNSMVQCSWITDSSSAGL